MPQYSKLDLEKIASRISAGVYLGTAGSVLASATIDPLFLLAAVPLGYLSAKDIYLRHIQTEHAIPRNFGIFGSNRSNFESIGPEIHQYFVESDTDGTPFSRDVRSELYAKGKNVLSTNGFGSLGDFRNLESTLLHSFYPKEEVEPFSLTFGEERDCVNTYTITNPLMISAMSFGSLGKNAVMALSKGAGMAGIPMNTGEGGLSEYHLYGGNDIIFQIGTAKFGVRKEDGTLDEKKLEEIANNPHVKMIEIKFSQGAKPGKGGMLPGIKVPEEIAKTRGVPVGQDIISPKAHAECDSPYNLVQFIKKIQDITNLPVGMKFCLGKESEFHELVVEMKKQNIFPDYMAIDGAEGGTGAAPRSYMDNVGVPLFQALDYVVETLNEEGVRDRLKIVSSGKLVDGYRQMKALIRGSDAISTARGFLISGLNCVQALKCNTDNCPAGILTHKAKLQKGLVVDVKAEHVFNYSTNQSHELAELVGSLGKSSFRDLDSGDEKILNELVKTKPELINIRK